MLRAIAMSLGEKIMGDCDRKDVAKQKQTKEVCFSNLVLPACVLLCIIHKEINADGVHFVPQESDTQVLSKESIDKFTMVALPACLNLVDTLPETVYRVCDLLMTITKRNGEVWRDEMLDTLVADVSGCVITVKHLLFSYAEQQHMKNQCDYF